MQCNILTRILHSLNIFYYSSCCWVQEGTSVGEMYKIIFSSVVKEGNDRFKHEEVYRTTCVKLDF